MPDSVYQNNIDAMRERFADIVALIEKPEEQVKMIDEESAITADITEIDGKTVLLAHKNDAVYRLDSLYESGEMLDVWFKSLGDEWDLNSKLFMYGLGNGMFVRKFLRSARPDCSIVVQEPSYKIFKTVLENFDLSDIFTDLRVRFVFWPLYIGNSVKSVYEDIMSYTDIKSFKNACYLNYPELFGRDCTAFFEGLERVRDYATANQIVHDRFGGDYNKNTFNNMLFLKESMDLVKLSQHMPKDIPAVIVAAGPSLDKNIKEIAKAKGKSLIISTDTALKPLSLAGIVPDIALIMDGKKDERYLSEEDSRQVPMVCTPRSGTEFLHLHTGIKFFTNDFCDHINNFLQDHGGKLFNLETGGSVANSSFSLAMLFHCKKVILMGQDLAYTGDKTHSGVTVRGSVKTEVKDLEHVVMDVDINGDPIRSSAEFKLYREWYEQKIAENPDVTVIDATEGGVRIAGTQLMTASSAIEKYCTADFDFNEVISKAVPLFDEIKKKEFDDYVKAVPKQMSDLRRLIGKTLADYISMRKMVQSDDYRNSRMRKLYDDCQKQTKMIEDNPVIEYVHNQMQEKSSELLDTVNKLEKDEKQELLTVCDIGEQYLRDMDNAITELEPFMDVIRKDFGA